MDGDVWVGEVSERVLEEEVLKNKKKTKKQIKKEDISKRRRKIELFKEKIIPEKQDALLAEINDFIKSINSRNAPKVDGKQGLQALEIALDIENKIIGNGT